MLQALLISNGLQGLDKYYVSNERVQYTVCLVTKDFAPDLAPYDLLVVPNGSDHVAMLKIKDKVRAFLDEGKALVCCDGFFTAWVPGNQWLMDNSRRTQDVRYRPGPDPTRPPVSDTNYDHPVYQGLTPRQACWHTHGVYTSVPAAAQILQTTAAGDVITWQTHQYGGTLLATTLDPLVEHGVQQITHLDQYVDRLTAWLSGVQPAPARLTIDAAAYGAGALL